MTATKIRAPAKGRFHSLDISDIPMRIRGRRPRPPLQQDVRLQVLPRDHIAVIERDDRRLSSFPSKYLDPGKVRKLIGSPRGGNRLEDVNVRGQCDPAGSPLAPQYVDLEAVLLPDFHGDDHVLDV